MFNQAGATSFDASGRLAMMDHTWNRLLLIAAPPH